MGTRAASAVGVTRHNENYVIMCDCVTMNLLCLT